MRAIRLPAEIEQRPEGLVAAMGRTKSFYTRNFWPTWRSSTKPKAAWKLSALADPHLDPG
jgi:hypothetical protein